MPSARLLKAAQVLLAAFLCFQHAYAERLISAKNSRTTQTGNGIERTYADGVRATFGAVRIDADSAFVQSQKDDYVFLKSVHLRDGERSVRARALTYHSADSIARFKGGVRIRDAGRQIRADQVDYDLGRRLLTALGNVGLRTGSDVSIAAGKWFHDARMDTGRLEIDVLGTHVAEGETMSVRSPRARLSAGVDTIVFVGGADFKLGLYEGWCDSLSFVAEDGIVHLSGDGRMTWISTQNTGAVDRNDIRGDLIVIQIEEGHPKGIHVVGDAHLASNRTSDSSNRRFQLDGATAEVTFTSGQIDEITADDDCRLTIQTESGDSTSMDSETSIVSFDSGELARIEMTAGGVAHRTRRSVHRVEGERVVLTFEAARVKTVLADSAARVLTENEGSHIQSHKIELVFEEGRLSSAEATGYVTGEVFEER